MERNDKLKENDIENYTYYYFDDIIKIDGFDYDNILLNEKSYKNILAYDISYKALIGTKPLFIRFDKVDGFFGVLTGIDILHYLALKI